MIPLGVREYGLKLHPMPFYISMELFKKLTQKQSSHTMILTRILLLKKVHDFKESNAGCTIYRALCYVIHGL